MAQTVSPRRSPLDQGASLILHFLTWLSFTLHQFITYQFNFLLFVLYRLRIQRGHKEKLVREIEYDQIHFKPQILPYLYVILTKSCFLLDNYSF
jgi:hypothetical protein